MMIGSTNSAQTLDAGLSVARWLCFSAGLVIAGNLHAQAPPQFDPTTGTLLPPAAQDESGDPPAVEGAASVGKPLDPNAVEPGDQAADDAQGRVNSELDAAATLGQEPQGIVRISGIPVEGESLEPIPLDADPEASDFNALFPDGEGPTIDFEEEEPAVLGPGRAGGFEGLGFAPPGALATPIPRAPNGFTPYGVVAIPGTGEMLKGFGFGVSLSTTYDSNVQRRSGAGLLGGGSEDDFIVNSGLVASYRSPGRTFWYSAGGSLGYSQYFNNSSFSGLNYGLNAAAGYEGAKLSVNANLTLSFGGGGDRYNNSFANQLNVGLALGANYTISSKTSIDASISTAFQNSDAAATSSTGDLRMSAGARWKYSPLLSWGLGLSWTTSGGDGINQQDRQSFGPYITASYTVTRKVSINANLGLGVETYSGQGGSEMDYNFSLGANYRANELWGMDLSVIGGTYANGSALGGYRDTVGARLGYNRSIGRNQLSLGLGWETSEQFNPGALAGANADDNYLTLDATLSRPLPSIRGSGSIFCRWEDQNGNAASSYDSYSVGASISTSF